MSIYNFCYTQSVKIFGRKISYATLIFCLILLLAAILRFYRLPDMASFDYDQEYAANFAYNVVHNHQKLLIGQGLSIQGLFMGPWYFYYLVPFFAITHLHPLGGYIGSVLLSLFGLTVLFIVSKKMFNEEVALIAAFLGAIRYNSFNTSWSIVPSYASGFLVLITWYCFYKYWHGETKLFPLLLLMFGLYTSIHPILFPFYFVFIIFFLIKKKLPTLKQGLFSLVAFIIPIAPLILFETLHSFLEVRVLLNLLSGAGSSAKQFSTLLNYLSIIFDLPGHNLSIQIVSDEAISLTIFLVFLFLLIKKVGYFKDNFHLTGLLITFGVYILYYFFYPAHVPDYYFNALGTLSSLYFAAVLGFLYRSAGEKFLLFAIILLITISNLYLLSVRWNNPSLTTLSHKDAIVKKILKRQPQNQEFFVSYINSPGWNSGFDYLFKVYGRVPQKEAARPPIYTIVVPKNLSIDSINYASGNIGVIWPKK